MTRFPDDTLRPLCERLAVLLESEAGSSTFRRLVRDLHQNELGAGKRKAPTGNAALGWDPQGVGIWEPHSSNGGVDYRRGTRDVRTFWANVEQIPAKSNRRRVVMVGESVARGFFYDPGYTPASTLETILQGALGTDVEVIDLARVDITIGRLELLIQSSLLLKPDVLVIFAGNNWNPYSTIKKAGLLQLCERLRQNADWSVARSFIEDRLKHNVKLLIQSVGRQSSVWQLPVIFVLPEFNLGDWRASGKRVPSLAPPELSQWLGHRSQAERAMAAGDAHGVQSHAGEMVRLDREEVAISLELQALAHLVGGQTAEARILLEKARDTALNLPVSAAPGCFSAIQDAFRTQAVLAGLLLVDLPRCFETYLSGGIPDRRLFLDYCHLNSDGIRLAMAATAQAILPLLGGAKPPLDDLYQGAPRPSARVEALARLFAAHHNFNWGQGYEVIHYQLSQAVQYDRNILPRIVEFLDFHCRKAPAFTCTSFTSFSVAEPVFTEYYLANIGHQKYSKLVLMDAALEIIAGIDPDASEKATILHKTEHGLKNKPTNLLNDYYARLCYADLSFRLKVGGANYQAFELNSQFFFVLEMPQRVCLTFTYRVPSTVSEDEKVSFSVNNCWTTALPASHSWRTVSFVVPGASNCSGMNSVDISWPFSCQSWRAAVDRALDTNDPEPITRVYRAYGEISTLRAELVQSSRTQAH